MRTFKFHSPLQDDTDSHEFVLATSPCLHSISAPYSEFGDDGRKDFSGEAVLRTVSGLAANLKEVQISIVSLR